MLSEVWQKENYGKLNRAQKAQFWGLKTWSQGGPCPPRPPRDPHLKQACEYYHFRNFFFHFEKQSLDLIQIYQAQ